MTSSLSQTNHPAPNADQHTALSIHSLGKQVVLSSGALTILDDVSFTVPAGTSAAIVGTSGSGKSTLLGLMAGLDAPTSGHVALGEANLYDLNENARAQWRLNTVSFVFQNFQLLDTLTAKENVMLPLELRHQKNASALAEQALAQVGLNDRMQHYPKQLSGGEQQRVAIARAFVTEPSLLFADEPTGNLDSRTGAQVADLLFGLNAERGTTLILVTHDEQLAARCDQVLRLEAGRLIAQQAGEAAS